ncbi:MAG: 4-hydroxybenzoate polyprenyltransferase [Pseudohongiellaceae bacterium]|jgi:4-hydroxybenzoate polyprenyltransferase
MSAAVLTSILADIKVAHSIFALPFAAIGLLVGTRGQAPGWGLSLAILGSMILARSAAMGFNRLVDHQFDVSNPRTAGRALPSGRVSRQSMIVFVVSCSLGFVVLAGFLGELCLLLSPVVLVVLFAYSLAKRVTTMAHVVLGFALALAPPAAYLAARGSIESDVVGVLWFALAVLLWVAGFDIIYACQDVDHDRKLGLYAVPAKFGTLRALALSRVLHLAMIGCLLVGAHALHLETLTSAGIVATALILIVEHGLVRGGRLERIDAAFFTMNGVVGLVFAGCVGSELILRASQLWP